MTTLSEVDCHSCRRRVRFMKKPPTLKYFLSARTAEQPGSRRSLSSRLVTMFVMLGMWLRQEKVENLHSVPSYGGEEWICSGRDNVPVI